MYGCAGVVVMEPVMLAAVAAVDTLPLHTKLRFCQALQLLLVPQEVRAASPE